MWGSRGTRAPFQARRNTFESAPLVGGAPGRLGASPCGRRPKRKHGGNRNWKQVSPGDRAPRESRWRNELQIVWKFRRKSLGGSKSMSLQCADTWVKPSHHTWAGFSARADVSLCGVASMPGRMLPSAGRDELAANGFPLSLSPSSPYSTPYSTPRDAQSPFARSTARPPMHVAPAATAHRPPAPRESIPPILVFGPRDFPDRRVSL